MRILNKIGFFSLIIFGVILLNITSASNWNLPGVTIISRAEWGADESLRFRSTPRPTNNSSKGEKTEAQIKAENISKIRNAWMAKNFPLERKYERLNSTFLGHYLIYPEYFNYHKNKIVIHHTAGDYDPNRTINDVKKQIQDIYKYHTINRDFGDIGYNFLIDQMGNIYEGRSGGEGAVGMHASSNNITSIGIALMGNFENDTPTVEQMSALVNLVTAVAKYYHIDPHGYTYTFSINSEEEPYVVATKNPNIMGHKNVKATACPGTNLYKFLPQIRDEVLRRMEKGIVGDAELPSKMVGELKRKTDQKKVSQKETYNTKIMKDFPERLTKLQKDNPGLIQNITDVARENYNGDLTSSNNRISKITKKYTINDVKNIINQNISVLLYELTTNYNSFEIMCDMSCIFNVDGINYNRTGATLTLLTNKIQMNSDRSL